MSAVRQSPYCRTIGLRRVEEGGEDKSETAGAEEGCEVAENERFDLSIVGRNK